VPVEGSNVILMTWTDGGATTWVSYRYQEDPKGAGFGLYRVACVDGACSSVRVLGDLAAPTNPDGTALAWNAGDVVPGNVIDVDYPTVAGGTDGSVVCPEIPDPTADPCDRSIGQRRVVVTVNGDPAFDGTPRSSRITVSAGGTKLDTLAAPTFTAPSATPARTECGGPITLVVDKSGSIGAAGMTGVKAGLVEVVNTLSGTPTMLQIVTFSDRSDALGPGAGWNEYFDMSDPNSATTLITAISGLSHGGSTNWEDALFRTFFNNEGRPHSETGIPTAPMPELVVLFTDGMPTRHRASGASYRSDPDIPNTDTDLATSKPVPVVYNHANAYDPTQGTMSPLAWFRADDLLGRVVGNETYGKSIRVMGIGVGPEFVATRQMYNSSNILGTSRYTTDRPAAQIIPGWPTGGIELPHEKFLGNLLDAGEAWDTTDLEYVAREWNEAEKWGDLTGVDLLKTSDISRGASALSDIVLDKCGGTLTLQTKLSDGRNAPFNATYTMDGTTTVTTSRGVRTGTFDVTFDGQTRRTVAIVPDAEQIQFNGKLPSSWACSLKGQPMAADRYSLLDVAAGAAGGISITIDANEAVSCTLIVTP
jgi:von Willebrand factor type A domain